MSSGYVAYSGPSLLREGADIVALITTKSANVKTGDMYQMWILDQAQPPTEIARLGLDDSICGNCGMRPIFSKGSSNTPCYVTLVQAPNRVWVKWKGGGYNSLPSNFTFKRPLRLGAYGDPAALPLATIASLTSQCTAGWTGYTHQWRTHPELKPYCMASVEGWGERRIAGTQGWRTFRVIKKGSEAWESSPLKMIPDTGPFLSTQSEIVCPASNEAGNRTTCIRCRLCNGKDHGDNRKNICIEEH